MHFVAFCFWWCKMSPSEVRACAESTIEIVFWDFSDTAVSTSLLPVLFYQILDLFFSFAENLLGFILVGKFFGKDLRTRCLKKWIFIGIFWWTIHAFLAFFSSLLDWIMLILASLERFLPLHKLVDIVVLDHATDVDPQGQLQANGLRSWIWRLIKIQGVYNAYSIITGVTYFSCEFYG